MQRARQRMADDRGGEAVDDHSMRLRTQCGVGQVRVTPVSAYRSCRTMSADDPAGVSLLARNAGGRTSARPLTTLLEHYHPNDSGCDNRDNGPRPDESTVAVPHENFLRRLPAGLR